MENLFKKLEVFKRKNNVDCIRSEKQGLAEIIFGALKHRGSLNDVQRSQVLSVVVEQWKTEQAEKEYLKRKEHLESEESNDISKGISLYLIDNLKQL